MTAKGRGGERVGTRTVVVVKGSDGGKVVNAEGKARQEVVGVRAKCSGGKGSDGLEAVDGKVERAKRLRGWRVNQQVEGEEGALPGGRGGKGDRQGQLWRKGGTGRKRRWSEGATARGSGGGVDRQTVVMVKGSEIGEWWW